MGDNAFMRMAAEDECSRLRREIERQHKLHENEANRRAAEIKRLQLVLRGIGDYADGCMEGAGEPEFSQFASISNTVHQALAN